MMAEGKGLHNFQNIVIGRRPKQKRADAERLGDVAKQLMQGWISTQQSRYESLTELWGELLPEELGRHCEITDVSGGQLKVAVDSPSYVYELRLCSTELLKELRQKCPSAKINKIRFVVS